MLSLQKNFDIPWEKIKKDAFKLSEKQRSFLKEKQNSLNKWKEENPIEYLGTAFFFDSMYRSDTYNKVQNCELIGWEGHNKKDVSLEKTRGIGGG